MATRPTCTFCGAIPEQQNESGQPTCYRHRAHFDLTGDEGARGARGARGGRGAKGLKRKTSEGSLGSQEEPEDPEDPGDHDDFAVPHLKGKGKGKGRAVKRPRVAQKECLICMCKFRSAGVSCGAGTHHSCKGCTRDYITKTLGGRGTVYFDRIPCLSPDCWAVITATDAKGVLTKKVVEDLEKKEWDVAYLLTGEVDPSSQALMNKKTRPCPNCKVPIEHGGACDHMTCVICKHEFWFSCSDTCTNYPFHAEGCSARYASAHVNA